MTNGNICLSSGLTYVMSVKRLELPESSNSGENCGSSPKAKSKGVTIREGRRPWFNKHICLYPITNANTRRNVVVLNYFTVLIDTLNMMIHRYTLW